MAWVNSWVSRQQPVPVPVNNPTQNPWVYLSKQVQKHPNQTGIEGDMLKMSVSNHFDYNSAKIHLFGMFLSLFKS
jgi:hypothetical protein